ncbi:hypothetical protein L916_12852 [Phytophthora nicotianae]|uniref:Uncharacterized protein n=1 Tax=Phytophthora nicotianae TaxID=4792 RepID=W2ILG7_PHYNI|nr:hypothetical protein L916_12852 [Phytophthora nicotianae]
MQINPLIPKSMWRFNEELLNHLCQNGCCGYEVQKMRQQRAFPS